MLWYNGISSGELGVVVEHYPPRPVPKRKASRWSIPGRSGDLIRYEDAWENVIQTYEIAIVAPRRDLSRQIGAVAAWLMATGYHRLEDSYDPEIYRMAAFLGGPEVEDVLHRFGRARIQFDCCPQRYLKAGEELVTFTAAGSLFNPTGCPAKPIITLRGSGAATLTVGGSTLQFTSCSGLILDCDTENASGIQNANADVSGTYPILGAGETAISFSGGITSLEIFPRWYEI